MFVKLNQMLPPSVKSDPSVQSEVAQKQSPCILLGCKPHWVHIWKREPYIKYSPPSKALVPSPATSPAYIQGQDPLPQFQDPPFSIPKAC